MTDRDVRYDALELAVKHHGYANHSAAAIPASTEVVIMTADTFRAYLETGELPRRGRIREERQQ